MGGPDSNEFRNTPRIKKDIFDAAAWNDEDAVKDFVERKNVPTNATNTLQQTAAHIAVAHRDMAILDYLLKKDPFLVSAKDKWGQTILHVAEQKGYMEIVEHLVEDFQADIYQPIDGRFGNTAIHLAAEECRLEMMMYFLESKNADVNVKNALGESPLFSAASNNHLDMVKYLIEKRKADPTALDINDDNILFVSARRGDLRVPRYLLDERKVQFDVDWRDNFGDTIIHRATKYNHLKFIKYFVEEKHADINIYDNFDRTPVYLAATAPNLEIVKYLCEQGAHYKLNDLKGKTPLQMATDKGVIDYLQSLIEKRNRRSIPEPEHEPRTVLCKWIQRSFSGDAAWTGRCLEGCRLRGSGELGFSQVDNLLLLADACVRNSKSSRQIESLSSPQEIVKLKMESIAMDAVNDEFNFRRMSN